jgi:hypothetical protein
MLNSAQDGQALAKVPLGPPPASRARPSIEARKAERELFFWTAERTLSLIRRTLGLVVLIALTIYVVTPLITGKLPDSELLLDLLHRGLTAGAIGDAH